MGGMGKMSEGDSPMPAESSGKQRPPLVKALFVMVATNGFSALLFGGIMMLFPVNTPLGLDGLLPAMGDFPFPKFFETLFFPGLALFLCNGVGNLASAWFFFRKNDRIAAKLAFAGGILLVIWDVYEFVFLPNPLAIVYGVVGVAQMLLSVLALRKR